MVFTFYQTVSNKQTKKSLGCHQVSSLDMIMLSHPQGVATAVVYSTADGAMWAKDREIGRFRRSVNLLGKMEYNHRKKTWKNWIYPGQQVSWLVMWIFFLLEDVPGNTPQASACFVGAFQVLQVPERTGKFGAAQYSSMARKLPIWQNDCVSRRRMRMENHGLSGMILIFARSIAIFRFLPGKTDMSQPTQVVDTPSLDDIVDADTWGRQAGSRGFLLSYLARDRYLRYL